MTRSMTMMNLTHLKIPKTFFVFNREDVSVLCFAATGGHCDQQRWVGARSALNWVRDVYRTDHLNLMWGTTASIVTRLDLKEIFHLLVSAAFCGHSIEGRGRGVTK